MGKLQTHSKTPQTRAKRSALSQQMTTKHKKTDAHKDIANPTHRRLSKMVGRSVENEIEIRADIKTHALLSRGSTDIYADICTVYVSNSMSFSTVCRQVRDFSAGVGSVTSAPKYCRSKSASSPKIVINKKLYIKIRLKDILISRLRTWLAYQKHLHCAFGEIF